MRFLRELLCRIFNLVLREEYDLINLNYQAQRQVSDNLRVSLADAVKGREAIDQERLNLQQLIFKNYGVISSDAIASGAETQNLNPVRMSSPRWSNLKRQMEEDDRKRAAAQ